MSTDKKQATDVPAPEVAALAELKTILRDFLRYDVAVKNSEHRALLQKLIELSK